MSKTFEIRLDYSLTHTPNEKVDMEELIGDWRFLTEVNFMVKHNFFYKENCTSCGNLIFSTSFISGCGNCHNSFVE